MFTNSSGTVSEQVKENLISVNSKYSRLFVLHQVKMIYFQGSGCASSNLIRKTEGYPEHHRIDPYFIGYAFLRLNERRNHDPPLVLGSRCPEVLKRRLEVATRSLNMCLKFE